MIARRRLWAGAWMSAALLALAAAGCSAEGLPLSDAVAGPLPAPASLAETGLYSDFAARTIDPANRAYTPAFALWSDGAAKSRWIGLPAGAPIDVSNLDDWVFPVGTRVWKEFRADLTDADGTVRKDQRIETRLLWKRAVGDWLFVTYVWSADQSTATLATETAPPPVPFPGTSSYEVPVSQCHTCHDRKADAVLGFEAALLAAPEADQSGLTWDALVAEGLVTSTTAPPPSSALQFLSDATPTERSAVGYLHANCGITCHHATSGEKTPFNARIEWGSVGPMPARIDETAIFTTAIGQRSTFIPKGSSGNVYRICPTDEGRSTLLYRMSVRNGLKGGGEQMPPVDTHTVDSAALTVLTTWVDGMTAAPYPAPGP